MVRGALFGIGPVLMIASPQGLATVNPTGNPGMATAGMGDVLTGTIAALIAQGTGGYDAARLGAFVHGMAGDRAARERGHHGMSAGDTLEELPRALLALTRIRDGGTPRDARGARSHGV